MSNSPSTLTSITNNDRKRKGQRISMVTAYDYPSALHVDWAGIDVILVGDSVAMVELGYPTTQPVGVDQMVHHCQVRNGWLRLRACVSVL